MRLILTLLAALGAASPAAAAADPAEQPVLAAVQRFFDAMAAQDGAGLREVTLPGSVFTAMRQGPDGAWAMSRVTIEDFTKAIPPGLHEAIWAPVVSLRGPIATVSAPYEFQRNGQTSHCGIDVFNLVKVDGGWKVAGAMWTAEPAACPELKARTSR